MSNQKEIYEFDAIIIGAGIVGLAIAHELSKVYGNVLVIDKEKTFGRHISSRNSEVIHSGLYYEPNSLKAKLCIKGNRLMYDFSKKYNIIHRNCGKLIVISTIEDLPRLEVLMQNGIQNDVEGLQLLNQREVSLREPLIKTSGAIYVPSTGIVDSHSIMQKLEYLIKSNDSNIIYNTELKAIIKEDDNYLLTFNNMEYQAKSKIVINSAGLWCDKIANMVGIDEYKLHYCKGEYYKTHMYRNELNSLIYPLPTEISLGIHIVLHLDGTIGFGPNAYYVDEIDFSIDSSNKKIFLDHINTYLDIPEDALIEDFIGIRPKIQAPGKSSQDFIIINEKEKGYDNLINLIGIESPGLTASLAIAQYVKGIINY